MLMSLINPSVTTWH